MCGKSFALWCGILLFFSLSSNSLQSFIFKKKHDDNSIVTYEFFNKYFVKQTCFRDRGLSNLRIFYSKIFPENERGRSLIYEFRMTYPYQYPNNLNSRNSFEPSRNDYELVETYIKYNKTSIKFGINVDNKNDTLDHEFDDCLNEIIKKIDDFVVLNELTIRFSGNEIYCHIVSMLCMLAIYLVYSILPDSIHTFMLRKYTSLLFISNLIEIIFWEFDVIKETTFANELIISMLLNVMCWINGLVIYFCFLAKHFWLSVMSFDIWWTFRDLRSLQRNVKQQKRKKLIYSILVWGSCIILVIFSCIFDIRFRYMTDYLFFRDKFKIHFNEDGTEDIEDIKDIKTIRNINSCWLKLHIELHLICYYVIKSICTISSICLSIYTTLKIARYEKDTTRHLKGSENQCYNNNKQWLTLYLLLFIMLFILMAINWIILTLILTTRDSWKFDNNVMQRILFINFLINTIEDIGMFVVFICKKTVMQQLLKECQNHRFAFKIWKRSNCYKLEQITDLTNVSSCQNNFSIEKYQQRESEQLDK